MKRIKQLPAFIANQIAAGEVVERPASVLKELLENSLDAESNNITVIIKKGGIGCIKVIDDGAGIHKDDLKLACMQHATSKIIEAEDLRAIRTLGFRGEALASIASVSKLEIISTTATQKNAWKIITEDGVNYTIEPVAYSAASGTSVICQDLFFNVPARRHFLRTEKTELYQLEEIFKRAALSNFNTSFTLVNDDKQIFKLPIATTVDARNKRIAKIFGNSFFNRAAYIEAKNNDLEFYGWITKPSDAKTQGINQYVFINNRIVKDKLINHSIKQAYSQVCDLGKNPNYCFYLNLNAEDLDVNVHPTKYEVRFKNARLVHSFISSAIIDKLGEDVVTSDVASVAQMSQVNLQNNQMSIKNKDNYNTRQNRDLNNFTWHPREGVDPVKIRHASEAWHPSKTWNISETPGLSENKIHHPSSSQEMMILAIEEAQKGVVLNDGGPFGVVIVKDNQVIAKAHNTVIKDKDPTCHAEINAIRIAAKALGTHILDECVIFTTSEPCPMCLAAIFWARIKQMYIGIGKDIAAKYGFDDAEFYTQLSLPNEKRNILTKTGILQKDCEDVFKKWQSLSRPLY